MIFSLSLLSLWLLAFQDAQAIRIPFETRIIHADRRASPYRLHPRAATVQITDITNTQYLANMTIGGVPFRITLDTGSSDLWVAGNVPGQKSLGVTASVQYAKGSAAGEVNAADATFSGFTVSDQAFIFVANRASTGLDMSDFDGILGLGPSSSSVVRQSVNTASGDPFLDRVFRQNASTGNFITFTLGRAGDVGDKVKGELTIGEVIPGFEAITNQPKIPVQSLPGPLKVDQHWSGIIDAIIGPDGKNIELDSVVPDTPDNKLVSIFDSGFTLPQVPRSVSDAIYGRVKGATFSTDSGIWTLPCDQELNVTVVIAGQKYPIHPLDISSSDLLSSDDGSSQSVCAGTFQPISTALDGTFDAVMGMAFLRNTYTYIDFGDFVDGNPENQGDPFMRLLSVTKPSDAHSDFVQIRLNGIDTTGDSDHALLPPGQTQNSPAPKSEKAKNLLFRYWPWIVAGVGVFIVIGLVWLLFRCCCRRRNAYRGAPISGPYRPLRDPAPAAAMDLHTMAPPQGVYSDPYYRGPHY